MLMRLSTAVGCTLLLSSMTLFILGAEKTASAADVSSPSHEILAADNDKLIKYDKTGKPVWVFDVKSSIHKAQQLANGNILTHRNWNQLIEVTPDQEIVWTYDSGTQNGNAGKEVEVHTFQRHPDGRTLIVENGVGRVITIDKEGKLLSEFPIQVKKANAHSDVRQAKWLENGNVLVCQEADGKVVEYSSTGEIVWDYEIPLFDHPRKPGHGLEAWGNQTFNALRLPNGNTLIATGNGHSVIEVTPDRNVVWHLSQNDLEGIQLAWITTLEVLPNGNLIIGNCHAGPENPQIIEVSRDKKLVWSFRDFELLGDSTAFSATVGIANVLR